VLKRIKSVIRKSLERSHFLEGLYIRIAVFCSEHGITPPLSGNPEKIEQEWRNQYPGSDDRDPCYYLEHDEQMDLLFMDIFPLLEKEANILEIGCSAGRHLNYLHSKGYERLTGIEIGAAAEDEMKKSFPDAYSKTDYIVGNAFEELVKLPTGYYDLVFTRGVLINVAPKWNGIFGEMARVSKAYILTMETEGVYVAFPRNFERMFRRAGCRQIIYKLYKRQGKRRILASYYDRSDIFNSITVRLFAASSGRMVRNAE
jgi:2-polyprenyl-3-methyl-5-hydroxy-6-metoxy-1,4-benzoquinol methylase